MISSESLFHWSVKAKIELGEVKQAQTTFFKNTSIKYKINSDEKESGKVYHHWSDLVQK